MYHSFESKQKNVGSLKTQKIANYVSLETRHKGFCALLKKKILNVLYKTFEAWEALSP